MQFRLWGFVHVVRQWVIPLIVALLGAAAVSPIATAAPNLEQMSDEDLEKLTPDQIEQTPVIDLWGRVIKPNGRQASVYMIEGLLYDLRYYPHLPVGAVTPNLTKAVSAFQEKIKAPVTGVLLTGEFKKLRWQAEFVQSQDILPLGPQNRAEVITSMDDYVLAQGTWTLKEGVAYPIHTVEITCDKREKTCREVIAEIHPPEEEGLPNSGTYLALLTSSYPIVKWEGNIVVAERGGSCRTLTLTIDANRKEVYQIARNGTGDKSCPLPALDEPRIATLTGSFKAGLSHNQQQRREKALLYAPAYQEVLRALDLVFSPKEKEAASPDGAAKPR